MYSNMLHMRAILLLFRDIDFNFRPPSKIYSSLHLQDIALMQHFHSADSRKG
jgi:hypothetical protein